MKPLLPAIAGVACLALASDAGGSTPVGRCPAPRAMKVLVSDRRAVVYEAEGRLFREVFACMRGARRAFALGQPPEYTPEGGGGVEAEVLHGTIVGYEENLVSPYGPDRYTVIVRDLARGRVIRRAATQGAAVTQVAVNGRGEAAWITYERIKPNSYAVVVADRAGIHKIGEGPGIAPSSIRLRGQALTWEQDGHSRSTTLW